MRGGPSTGIPTKAEQGDLNIAVYGVHGDAPRLVLAPQSVSDCVFTAQWSVYLSEALQVPAIVLSDQLIGQAQAAIERPADLAFIGERLRARDIAAPYQRYALGGAGVSPMAIPGTLGGQYTPMASPTRCAAFPPAAPAIIAHNSTSDATSWKPSTTGPTGRRSKAKESWP
jgi:2-oxoglutarate ferredoxin oxidoreductase subunit alpha